MQALLAVAVGLLSVLDVASATPLAARANPPSPARCTPFSESFHDLKQWTPLENDSQQFRLLGSGKGVELTMLPPQGTVHPSKDGKTNDKLGQGATMNSTAKFLYGRLTFEMASSPVAGVVTAAIVVSSDLPTGEIDVEVLGGDRTHWQTNIFRVDKGESGPLYGVFGEVESYPNGGTVEQAHAYTIDWSPDRLAWSVDGQVVRTLTRQQTYKNGHLHYPDALSRFQVGIWDASAPAGTSEWAHGPINWSKQGKLPITMTLKRVQLECPYN